MTTLRKTESTLGISEMDFNTGNWLTGIRSLQEQKKDAEPAQKLVSARRGYCF